MRSDKSGISVRGISDIFGQSHCRGEFQRALGEKPENELIEQHFKNPIRQALWYKQLLDEGQFNTQAELA